MGECDDITPEGARLVLAMVIRQAALDARRGDALARAWLADSGAAMLDDLEISVDIPGWLAELAPARQPALPGIG